MCHKGDNWRKNHVIEFLLIFALGFLAAALVGMLITPAIYGRIVKLTEQRIEATVPLSANEIKGKSDLLRARFASEAAKLSTKLTEKQEEVASGKVAANKLRENIATLAGEKNDANQKIDTLVTQSADLRSENRKMQQLVDKLSGTLTEYERVKRADTDEINRLNTELVTISTEVESMKVDLAAKGAEMNALEEDNDNLRSDLRAMSESAHEFESKYDREQQSHNDTRIELAGAQSTLADTEVKVEALETVRRELQEEYSFEQERHNNSRVELAGAQSSLSDAEMKLGDAGDKIAALETVRRELRDEIDNWTHRADELLQEREREESRHNSVRIEMAAAQSSLTDIEMNFGHARERIEALETVREELQAENRTLTETADVMRQDAELERQRHDETRTAARTEVKKISAKPTSASRLWKPSAWSCWAK